MPRVRLAHSALGLQGLAVIRNWLGGDQQHVRQITERGSCARLARDRKGNGLHVSFRG